MKKMLKKKKYLLAYGMVFFLVSSLFIWGGFYSKNLGVKEAKAARTNPLIIDHNDATLSGISSEAINSAKSEYRIFYGHTSHGSQIMTGLEMIESNTGGVYQYSSNYEESGALYFNENSGVDLGHNGDLSWVSTTREALSSDGNINMVMWSWCAGVSDNTEEGINAYLNAMNSLENEYPDVTFVYMTGHLWSGYTGTKASFEARNQQIIDYAVNNNKVLYNFTDIESYDPDGNFHDDTDACNWCSDWCASHDCPSCSSCAHSHCFNCYQKGKAFWNMMAQLAGGSSSDDSNDSSDDSSDDSSNDSSDDSSNDSSDDSSSTTEDTASRTTESGSAITPKIITTSGPGEIVRAQVYDRKGNATGDVITNLFPDAYLGGAGIAPIDSNNNGIKDQALIYAINNGGPQAKVIGIKSDKSISNLGQMFVFDSSIRDGLSATSGDFDGDGYDDDAAFCLTGDVAPIVRVYTDVSGIDSWTLSNEFRAPFGNVGCNLGTFQYDDGYDDILVTPNHTEASPNVYIYWTNGRLQNQFQAYPSGVQSGLSATGIGERIYTTPNNGSSQINVFDKTGERKNFWWAYQEHIRGDYTNVAGDIDLDGIDELLVSPIGSNGPQVLAYEPSGKWRTWPNFFAFGDETLRNGVGIAVIDNYHGVN